MEHSRTNHFQSLEQAIAVLKDTQQDELVRTDAIKFLKEDGSQEAIDVLISVLTDDDLGVRWAAADALAKLGAKAAPSVLRALLAPYNDDRFREVAYHIFKDNSDLLIRSEAEPLVAALKDTTTDIDELTEAAILLKKITS